MTYPICHSDKLTPHTQTGYPCAHKRPVEPFGPQLVPGAADRRWSIFCGSTSDIPLRLFDLAGDMPSIYTSSLYGTALPVNYVTRPYPFSS